MLSEGKLTLDADWYPAGTIWSVGYRYGWDSGTRTRPSFQIWVHTRGAENKDSSGQLNKIEMKILVRCIMIEKYYLK